ncbi:acyltransferase [Pseudomonas fluorescens]|uniref:acyltransferase family protein n=1 Tax=Pseudomonas fluorescens TaxID=294 RepID=UPI00054C0AA4|nr:acyltransferase [Pseudomonas fluorescens]KII33654.1 acyltransferase [Pseudomonas fluorescens]
MIKIKPAIPERLFTLDIVRGLAALSVVFWHWQHFFYVGGATSNFNIESQPFFNLFSTFYTRGSLAVELFFSISGFVFFWLFSKVISEKRISAATFFVDRFSRLYPLHIATLASVVILQYIYTRFHWDFFVYQTNDFYHGILNIFLIPAWGLEKDWSFNAPIWSVSVEILLYALFFATCLLGRAKYLIVPILIIIGYYTYPVNYKLGSGIFTFFCGGMAFFLLNAARSFLTSKTLLAITTIFSILAWSYINQSATLNMYVLMGLAFPMSVCALACANMASPNLLKPLSFIGDISYSSYLIHFPLQIVFAGITDRLGFARSIYYSPIMFISFVGVLLILSFGSHKLFEAPIQRAIRKAYKNRTDRRDLATTL